MAERRRYAEGTDVPVDRSRAELERLLKPHGAAGCASGWDDAGRPRAGVAGGAGALMQITCPACHAPASSPRLDCSECARRSAELIHLHHRASGGDRNCPPLCASSKPANRRAARALLFRRRRS